MEEFFWLFSNDEIHVQMLPTKQVFLVCYLTMLDVKLKNAF